MLKITQHNLLINRFIYYGLCLLFSTGCSTFHQDLSVEPINLADGVEYRVDSYLGQKIFVTKIDPEKAKISLVKAVEPLEKTSIIAAREQAIVAINAGYFYENGAPAGAFRINDNWIQKPKKNRGAVGWSDLADTFYFDRLQQNDDGKIVSEYHKNDWWEKQSYVVGGAPLLIQNGEAVLPEPEKVLDSFLTRRYARTAICMDNDQKVLLFVIEGGDSFSWSLGFRNGMNISELTAYLKTQHCVNALNLDGGKSSVMVVEGKAVNSQPHFFDERKVSDVITVSKK